MNLKVTKLLALLAMFILPLSMHAQSPILSYDFEDESVAGNWMLNSGACRNAWFIGYGASHESSQGMYISSDEGMTNDYNTSYASTSYAVTMLSVPADGRYEISYDWKAMGESSSDYLRVCLAPSSVMFQLQAGQLYNGLSSNTVPDGWTAIDGGAALNQSNVWTTFAETRTLTSGQYLLVFCWNNDDFGGASPAAAIDNIVVSAATCGMPTDLTVSNVVEGSATISWQCRGLASTWNIEYGESGFTRGEGMHASTNTRSIVLTGLLSDFPYDVYVTSICSATDSSQSAMTSFRSACSAIEVPYNNSFEGVLDNQFPGCWTNLAGDNSVQMGGYYPPTPDGVKVLKMKNNFVVASPSIPLAANETMMSFSLRREGYTAGNVAIGYVDDLTHLDQMTTLMTISPSDDNWHHYEIDCSNLSGEVADGYIVFKQMNANNDYYVYSYQLDDVHIYQAPTCKRPNAVTVSEVNHNSARVAWDEVASASSYELMYGTVNDPESGANTVVPLNDHNYQLTSLASATTYYIWVRGVCGDEYSEWRAGNSFTTDVACAAILNLATSNLSSNGVTLTWNADTETGATATAYEVAWRIATAPQYTTQVTSNPYFILSGLVANTNYQVRVRTICTEDTALASTLTFSTLPCGVSVLGDELTSANVPSYCNDGYSYAQMLYPASDLAGVDTIRGLSFNVASSSCAARNLDIYLAHTSTANLTYATAIAPFRMKLMATVQQPFAPGWNTIQFDSNFVYDGTSNLVVIVDDNTGSYGGFVNFNAHTGSSIYLSSNYNDILPASPTPMQEESKVPDIIFLGTCADASRTAPMLVLGEVASDQVELVWDDKGGNVTFSVEYKLATDASWTVHSTTSQHNAVISGLQAGTTYDFRVGNVLSGITLYSEVSAFTECSLVTAPIYESFQSGLNPCWREGSTGNTTPSYYGGEAYMGYQPGAYIITPQFENEVNGLQVRCSIKAYNPNSQLEILVGSNPNDFTTFIPIDTVSTTGSSAFEQQLVSLANYTGEGHYIAFHSLSNSLTLDDIAIEQRLSCEMPSNVVVDFITMNSADVIWEGDNSLTTKWLVAYRQQGTETYTQSEVDANTLSLTLSNLNADTDYEVLVANVCESGDTLWILNPVTFHTECAALALNQTETFEQATLNEYPHCWNRTHVAHYGLQYGPSYTEHHYAPVALQTEKGKSLNLFKGADVISPLVPLQGNQILVNFDAKSEDTSLAGDLVVGFTTSASDLTNMIAVDTLHFTTTEWANYDISFSGVNSADEGYVVFQNINYQPLVDPYRNDSTYKACFIDNITMIHDYGCARITNPQIVALDATSATISFSDAANTANYTIAYSDTNSFVDTIASIDFITTTYQLLSLQPSTRYYAWIRNNCQAGGSAWTAIPSFTTTCNAVELPYLEKFNGYQTDIMSYANAPESYPFHTMPNCWRMLGMSTDRNQNPQAYLYNTNSSSSSSYSADGTCLLMLAKPHTSMYAVLPQFSESINDLQISFTYRQSSAEDNHATLALGVMTNILDSNSFVTLQTYPRSMVLDTVIHSFAFDASLNASSHYAIAFRYLGGESSYDRMGLDNINVILAPTCIAPEQLTLSATTSTTANLTWLGNASNYKVAYRAMGTSAWTSQNVTTNSVTLSGLTFATTYQVRVQAICGAEDSSAWSNTISFTTECGEMAIPYSENFEQYHTDIAEGNNQPITYPHHAMPLCWEFPNLTNSPKIFLSRNDVYADDSTQCLLFTSSNERSAFAVLPAMSIDLSQLQIGFNYRSEVLTASCGELSVGVMTNPIDTTTFIPLQTYARETANTHASHIFATDEALQSGLTYHIAFRYGNAMGNGYFTGIDSVVVDYAPACELPTQLLADHITTTAANLSWSGNANQYDVAYRVQGISEWTDAITELDSTHYTLSNLQPETTYEWRVRAYCANTNTTTDWSTATFQTEAPLCEVPTLLTATAGETMVVLDWSAAEGQSSWTVNLFNADENLTREATEHPFTFDALTSGTTYSVAVRANCSETNLSLWSDTIQFTTTHPCNPVTNLSADQITTHSATISWTAGGEESAWEVMYGTQGFTDAQGTVLSVDAPQITLNDLEPATAYAVKVRAACSAELFSAWSAPLTFTTKSDTPQGIDGVEGNYQFTIYPNPATHATTITLNGIEGKVMISVVDINGRTITSETIECGSDCEKRIDVTNLAQGTYFVRLLSDNLNSVRKLIVR